MDFAPEPVLDAFMPPPTRQAPRAPAADDNGRSFNDHLDAAVNEPARERPAPAQTEARDETTQAPVEAKPAAANETEPSDDTLDLDVALLGGPLPPAPPPMAAPVIVQIAASQPTQQAPSGDAEAPAPVEAPELAAPAAPAMNTEAEADAKTDAPIAPSHAKTAQTEAKPAAPDAQPAQTAPQTANAQAQSPAAPVAVEELPPAIQQAIAATIAPAPQATVQTAQRPAKAAVQTDAPKAAPSAPDGKSEAPVANANTTSAPKASNAGAIVVDAAPVLQPQGTSIDTSQITQTNAVTTTSAQASTHVQHAAIDTGAQRATPAAAQVGREIIRRFDGGNTTFDLRLDPAELGRVEVRMEVTRDHRVTAVITADNPQALAELARNARELEQQLQSAGLQLSENGLSFDLRQGGQGGESGEANANARGANGEETLTEQQPAPVARPIGYERWRGVRVDMMV
jgi:hypothetical protein